MSAAEQPIILIVEDTLDFAQMTIHALRRIGLEVTHVTNAEDANLFISQQRPDLVLLDLNLPGKSGWEVLKYLKSTYGEDKVPVIVTSAYSDGANRLVGKLEDVYRYMIKPFPPQDLLATVRAALNMDTT